MAKTPMQTLEVAQNGTKTSFMVAVRPVKKKTALGLRHMVADPEPTQEQGSGAAT
jgi:hypothetical protein